MYEHGFKNNKEYFCLSASAVVAVRTYVYVIIHFFYNHTMQFFEQKFIRTEAIILSTKPSQKAVCFLFSKLNTYNISHELH